MEILPNDFLLPRNFAVKASVKKIAEITYSSEDGLRLKAALKKGPIKATLDQDGKVQFTGSLGRYSLKGDPTLKALGAKFKLLSISFSLAENGDIKYKAKVSVYGTVDFIVGDQFDLEKLLLDRGFLKGAYDAVKNREKNLKEAIDEQIN